MSDRYVYSPNAPCGVVPCCRTLHWTRKSAVDTREFEAVPSNVAKNVLLRSPMVWSELSGTAAAPRWFLQRYIVDVTSSQSAPSDRTRSRRAAESLMRTSTTS